MATSSGCCVVAQQRSTCIIKSDEASSVERRASSVDKAQKSRGTEGAPIGVAVGGNDSQGEGSIKR